MGNFLGFLTINADLFPACQTPSRREVSDGNRWLSEEESSLPEPFSKPAGGRAGRGRTPPCPPPRRPSGPPARGGACTPRAPPASFCPGCCRSPARVTPPLPSPL